MPGEVRLVDKSHRSRNARDRFTRRQAQRSSQHPDAHQVGMRRRADLSAKSPNQLEGRLRGDNGEIDQADAQPVVVADVLDRRAYRGRKGLQRSNRRAGDGLRIQFAILHSPELCCSVRNPARAARGLRHISDLLSRARDA